MFLVAACYAWLLVMLPSDNKVINVGCLFCILVSNRGYIGSKSSHQANSLTLVMDEVWRRRIADLHIPFIHSLWLFFFSANDIILSHMITFLNDKHDSQLRISFYENIVGVAAFVGHECSPILLPLLQQVRDPLLYTTLISGSLPSTSVVLNRFAANLRTWLVFTSKL